MAMRHILTFPLGNPKIAKSKGQKVWTSALMLAPATKSGFNVCQTAVELNLDCLKHCLNLAGQGGIFKKGETTNTRQTCRINRTKDLFINKPDTFDRIVAGINLTIKQALKADMVPAIRLNCLSDLPWEKMRHPSTGQTLLEMYPDLIFYDYTKSTKRMIDYIAGAMPKNYHLTYSFHEKSDRGLVDWFLNNGGNVAVIFHRLPEYAGGFQVINGDLSDARFLDPKGCIVGLKSKGPAKKSNLVRF